MHKMGDKRICPCLVPAKNPPSFVCVTVTLGDGGKVKKRGMVAAEKRRAGTVNNIQWKGSSRNSRICGMKGNVEINKIQ